MHIPTYNDSAEHSLCHLLTMCVYVKLGAQVLHWKSKTWSFWLHRSFVSCFEEKSSWDRFVLSEENAKQKCVRHSLLFLFALTLSLEKWYLLVKRDGGVTHVLSVYLKIGSILLQFTYVPGIIISFYSVYSSGQVHFLQIVSAIYSVIL